MNVYRLGETDTCVHLGREKRRVDNGTEKQLLLGSGEGMSLSVSVSIC